MTTAQTHTGPARAQAWIGCTGADLRQGLRYSVRIQRSSDPLSSGQFHLLNSTYLISDPISTNFGTSLCSSLQNDLNASSTKLSSKPHPWKSMWWLTVLSFRPRVRVVWQPLNLPSPNFEPHTVHIISISIDLLLFNNKFTKGFTKKIKYLIAHSTCPMRNPSSFYKASASLSGCSHKQPTSLLSLGRQWHTFALVLHSFSAV